MQAFGARIAELPTDAGRITEALTGQMVETARTISKPPRQAAERFADLVGRFPCSSETPVMSPLKISRLITYDHAASHPLSSAGGSPPLKLNHEFGFDSAARFQMLSVGGRGQLSVEGGSPSGMHFEVRKAPGICKVLNEDMGVRFQQKAGLVTLEGSAAGECQLSLVDAKGKVADSIDIKVVPFRSVVTRFYNLIDAKGRQGISPVDPEVSVKALEATVDEVNDIVGTQCSVFMAPSGEGFLRDLHVLTDLGDRVDLDKHLTALVASSDFDRAAQFHVAFVRGIAGPHSRGITKSNVTLLRTGLGASRALTLAHEFVHFLSGSGIVTVNDHDSERTDLLFNSFPHGINMRKDRLNKIIH